MSTDQSNSARPARGGYEGCDRPKCGFETSYFGECGNPVVPGMDVCHTHLEHSSKFNDDSDDRPVWKRQREKLMENENE